MSAGPLSLGSGRIAKARRLPSGLSAGSVSLSGPEVIATKRTDSGTGSPDDGRSANAYTTAPRAAASASDAATIIIHDRAVRVGGPCIERVIGVTTVASGLRTGAIRR